MQTRDTGRQLLCIVPSYTGGHLALRTKYFSSNLQVLVDKNRQHRNTSQQGEAPILGLPLPDMVPRPIPRLYFRDQIFWYRYQDFFCETKFFDTDTETSQKIVMGLETETETETFAYDWQILGMSPEKF